MDDEEYWPEIIGTGQAATSVHEDDDEPIACIYVPNTDTRSGWGMRMVYREREDRPTQIGFGRRAR
jgi:hypothetical protein